MPQSRSVISVLRLCDTCYGTKKRIVFGGMVEECKLCDATGRAEKVITLDETIIKDPKKLNSKGKVRGKCLSHKKENYESRL